MRNTLPLKGIIAALASVNRRAADLRDAELRSADFENACLPQTGLYRAEFAYANFHAVDPGGASLKDANLTGAGMPASGACYCLPLIWMLLNTLSTPGTRSAAWPASRFCCSLSTNPASSTTPR